MTVNRRSTCREHRTSLGGLSLVARSIALRWRGKVRPGSMRRRSGCHERRDQHGGCWKWAATTYSVSLHLDERQRMIGALILGLFAGFIGRALVPNDVFSD